MSATPAPITLTTDFGTTDHYVAQMKGAILGIAPGAQIVDVTHAIPPQEVRRAAFLVADLADAFPPRTAHVAVVDPGVGSERAILAVAAGGQFYVAPDNGLLTLVFDRHRDAEVVTVTNPQYRRHVVSSTFHGRDVMAPAAAHLVSGVALAELGPALSRPPVRLHGLVARNVGGRIEGEVAWPDRFGNLITNVSASMIADLPPDRLRVSFGLHSLTGLKRYYAEAEPGDPLLLVGSSGRLEIAVCGGSAAERFGIGTGIRVVVDLHPEEQPLAKAQRPQS
jgi:S-adenosylmethionine hydrolase